MRDPKRIKPFLNRLEQIWNKIPDWRFFQLIENFKRMTGKEDLFYMEDEEALKLLTQVFELEPEENRNQEDEIEDILKTI